MEVRLVVDEDVCLGSKELENPPGVAVGKSEYAERIRGLIEAATDGEAEVRSKDSILGLLTSDIIYSCRFKGSGFGAVTISDPA